MTEPADSTIELPTFWQMLGVALLLPLKRPKAPFWSVAALLIATVILGMIGIQATTYLMQLPKSREWSFFQVYPLLLAQLTVVLVIFVSQASWYRLNLPHDPTVAKTASVHLNIGRALAYFILFVVAISVPTVIVPLVAKHLLGFRIPVVSLVELLRFAYTLQPRELVIVATLEYVSQGQTLQWLAPTGGMTIVQCFIAARCCTLLPSAFYGSRRTSIRQAWLDTKGQSWRLTSMFIVVYVATLIIRLALMSSLMGPKMFSRIMDLGDLLRLPGISLFTALNVGIQYGGLWLLGGVWWASISLIVYRHAETRRISHEIATFD